MKYLFAPLEGITGYIFRQVYDTHFGGIDAYYTPFVTTRDGGIMRKKELRDIAPENNPGLHIVPQIMTTKADEFLQAASHMQELGYTEVNLNLGCPSGTVVPKGKGAAFLRNPEKLDRFLYEIYDRCPLAISIKSRIGFSSADEFPRLFDIYKQYPVSLLILHLRTREEMYEPGVHEEVFDHAYNYKPDDQTSDGCMTVNTAQNDHVSKGSMTIETDDDPILKQDGKESSSKISLCYNGDIVTTEDVSRISNKYPTLDYVMIGRGYLSHPGFAGNDQKKADYSDLNVIYDYVKDLQGRYEEVLFGETPVLFKLKELWMHLKASHPEGDKLFKKIKKVKHLEEYNSILREYY